MVVALKNLNSSSEWIWPHCAKLHIHSELKCLISFGNWFWHLIVGNRSIVLTFYQKRPVFALKIHPRPQRPKRSTKANKGLQSPKLQNSLISSIFNVKLSINVSVIVKKDVLFIDNFTLNIDAIKEFWSFEVLDFAGLCWPSLAFAALDKLLKQKLAFFVLKKSTL